MKNCNIYYGEYIHLLILTYIDNIFIHLYKDYKESIA